MRGDSIAVEKNTKINLEIDPPRFLEVKADQIHRSLSESDPDELPWPLILVMGGAGGGGGAQVFADSITVSN